MGQPRHKIPVTEDLKTGTVWENAKKRKREVTTNMVRLSVGKPSQENYKHNTVFEIISIGRHNRLTNMNLEAEVLIKTNDQYN